MNFIHKTNNYLIERFPTVWNTKIVWMLLINLVLHCLFFLIGATTHIDDFYSLDTAYYAMGWGFVASIISMLMLVGWVILLLKNNAFKNFYPTSQAQLFGQFLCYLIIIFCATSFAFSFKNGLMTFGSIETKSNWLQDPTLDFNDFSWNSLQISIWRSFFWATFLFNFRISNLRTLLFSILTTGVLGLLIGLLTLIYSFGISSNPEYFAAYLVLFLGTIILGIPIFMPNLGSKLFRGILINISTVGFVPYVLLILSIIDMHQTDACYECAHLFKQIGSSNLSYLLFAIGLIFIFFYTAIIKKWRALPE